MLTCRPPASVVKQVEAATRQVDMDSLKVGRDGPLRQAGQVRGWAGGLGIGQSGQGNGRSGGGGIGQSGQDNGQVWGWGYRPVRPG